MIKKNKPQTIVKSIRLNKELTIKIETLAKEQNRNFSNMVETLLLNILK